jgi:hypothetical protein
MKRKNTSKLCWMEPDVKAVLEKKLTLEQLSELDTYYWNNMRGQRVMTDVIKKYLSDMKFV